MATKIKLSLGKLLAQRFQRLHSSSTSS
jgi:hypothetical protein